jgi:hypothetical protein
MHSNKYVFAINPYGRSRMQQDVFLVREILIAIKNANGPSGNPDIPQYKASDIDNHLDQMFGDGYIVAERYDTIKAEDRPKYIIRDFTARGRELAVMMNNPPVWNELISKFDKQELNALPLSEIESLLRKFTSKWAAGKAGV